MLLYFALQEQKFSERTRVYFFIFVFKKVEVIHLGEAAYFVKFINVKKIIDESGAAVQVMDDEVHFLGHTSQITAAKMIVERFQSVTTKIESYSLFLNLTLTRLKFSSSRMNSALSI